MTSPYSIEISQLAEGRHTFQFHLRGDFFAATPEAEILDADIAVSVELDKTRRHLDLHLHFVGWMQLACDRCLQPYRYPIASERQLIFSHNEAHRDAEDEILSYLPREAHRLDLSTDLFDFVALCVPLRKVPETCPSPTCPPEVLSLLFHEDSTETEGESELARQLRDKLGSSSKEA